MNLSMYQEIHLALVACVPGWSKVHVISIDISPGKGVRIQDRFLETYLRGAEFTLPLKYKEFSDPTLPPARALGPRVRPFVQRHRKLASRAADQPSKGTGTRWRPGEFCEAKKSRSHKRKGWAEEVLLSPSDLNRSGPVSLG